MPSQPSAPPLPLLHPDYPFQQIVPDYFQERGYHYRVIADRFSCWPTLLFCGASTSSHSKLIDKLKTYFSTYGIPEEMATDGGSTFMAYDTQKFLATYGVKHRLSSVAYPHSNQRAELAVKSMKRLLRDNVGNDGRLNSDRFQRAVLQYRNTPDRDTGRSPAQVIFGRELRDFLPAPLSRYKPHPRWLMLQEDREKALRMRALRNTESLKIRTRQLAKLNIHDIVQIQNQVGHKSSRWDLTGIIVEVKPHDQYLVKVHGSGRLTLRNRKFLKKIKPYGGTDEPFLLPSYSGIGSETHDRNSMQNDDVDNSHVEDNTMPSNLHDSVLNQDSEPPNVEPILDLAEEPEITQPTEIQVQGPELRRSSRVKVEPQRLNISTWKGQSYEANGVYDELGYLGRSVVVDP